MYLMNINCTGACKGKLPGTQVKDKTIILVSVHPDHQGCKMAVSSISACCQRNTRQNSARYDAVSRCVTSKWHATIVHQKGASPCFCHLWTRTAIGDKDEQSGSKKQKFPTSYKPYSSARLNSETLRLISVRARHNAEQVQLFANRSGVFRHIS